MEGTPAIYLGRIVEKKNFRAFIYDANGQRRLVESWDEFEANMQSGIWFASKEDAKKSVIVDNELEDQETIVPKAKKSKSKNKPKPVKAKEIEEDADVSSDSLVDAVFEVTDENR